MGPTMPRRSLGFDFTENYQLEVSSDEDDSDFGFLREDDLAVIRARAATSNSSSSDFEKSTNGVMADGWEDKPESTEVSAGSTSSKLTMAIRYACTTGNLEALKKHLASEPQQNINDFFKDTEETPLITACRSGQFKVVEYLIDEQQADPNLSHPVQKQTPLMFIACCSRWPKGQVGNEDELLQCADKLVKAGATVNSQDERLGLTALMAATKAGKRQLAQYLLENGADPNQMDVQGCTALFYAVKSGDGRMCCCLLEHGADINAEDNHGWCVPELAQDLGFPRLAALLFSVKDTKWKPGLHPELLQQLEECTAASRKPYPPVTLEACPVLLMLQAVNGEKYLPKFREHKISFPQLLTLNEDQLKEIGVDNVGIRERLLDQIRKTHNCDWQEGSLSKIPPNKRITAAELVCIVVNLRNHMELIGSSLSYASKRIKEKPESLCYGKEKMRMKDLMVFCEQLDGRVRLVHEKTLGLHKILDDVQEYSELKIAGQIPKRSFQETAGVKSRISLKLAGKLVFGMGVIVGGMICVIKYKRTIAF